MFGMVLGWIYVYFNTRRLARHSEIGSLIGRIETLLQEVSNENSSFWKSDEEIKEFSSFFNAKMEHKLRTIEDGVKFIAKRSSSVNFEIVIYNNVKKAIVLIEKYGGLRVKKTNFGMCVFKFIRSREESINKLSSEFYNECADLLENLMHLSTFDSDITEKAKVSGAIRRRNIIKVNYSARELSSLINKFFIEKKI